MWPKRLLRWRGHALSGNPTSSPPAETDLWEMAWNSDFTNALTHLRAIGGSIDDTLDRPDRFVRIHWEAIKQVAEMLEEHDSVSGEDIDAVLAQTCGSYPG